MTALVSKLFEFNTFRDPVRVGWNFYFCATYEIMNFYMDPYETYVYFYVLRSKMVLTGWKY